MKSAKQQQAKFLSYLLTRFLGYDFKYLDVSGNAN